MHMIARVTLEVAIGRELDYLIPDDLGPSVLPGSRVMVPLGKRSAPGCVTAVLKSKDQTGLKSVIKVLGTPSLITPKVLRLTRWMAEYYCCPAETAIKSVLPEAVRREDPGWKEKLFITPVPDAKPVKPLTRRQSEIHAALLKTGGVFLSACLSQLHCTPGILRKMEDAGLLRIAPRVIERDPYGDETIVPSKPLPLNPEQSKALDVILHALESSFNPSNNEKVRPFLLHGVTGSGKTEVYLQAIEHALTKGRGAIVLVPEISLTPQTVERFKARFSAGSCRTLVAVLHSHLSSGERHDEWHKIRTGRARIVVGARSAIFAPVEPLALVIVDEEHEHSYKQEEAPRYHARDVAVMRGQMENAVVVLGSATPSMESYHNAIKNKYSLLNLQLRADDKKMPFVRVVDMRQAARGEKGVPIFSPRLKEGILQRLEKGEQVILFLNRRGYATSLQCPKCGFVATCDQCSVSMTYHRADQKLMCHICGRETKAPSVCPVEECRNEAIRYAGLGTEKVESTLRKLFTKARIVRMDSDTLRKKQEYRRILGDFKTGKIDILLGTQMIAKGLHFPNVTLAGIIHADLSLHIPDFRAGERTFQLLTQVAGRAGRGDVEGEVVVQSFTPFHPAIQYARRHDYEGFYEQELEMRTPLQYPPVARVALITLRGRNEEKVQFYIGHFKPDLESIRDQIKDLNIAGPAPAPLAKAETFYRFQLMLRTRHMVALSRALAEWRKGLKLPEDLTLVIDIDPVNLM